MMTTETTGERKWRVVNCSLSAEQLLELDVIAICKGIKNAVNACDLPRGGLVNVPILTDGGVLENICVRCWPTGARS